MYMDDLPIWGIVGEMKHEKEEEKTGEKEYSIWTHKKFEIGYSNDQIVDIQLTSEHKVKLEEGAKIPFTVEIIWKPSEVKFTDRYEKYRAVFLKYRIGTINHFWSNRSFEVIFLVKKTFGIFL